MEPTIIEYGGWNHRSDKSDVGRNHQASQSVDGTVRLEVCKGSFSRV
jgi:hypothetical protein